MPFWLKVLVSIQLPLQSATIVCKKETRKKNHYHLLFVTVTETHYVESLVAPCVKSTTPCISEEILGIAWELLEEGSSSCGESSSGSRKTCLWPRARQVTATVE